MRKRRRYLFAILLLLFAWAGYAVMRLDARARLIKELERSRTLVLTEESKARAQWLRSQAWLPGSVCEWLVAATARPRLVVLREQVPRPVIDEFVSLSWPDLEKLGIGVSRDPLPLPADAPRLAVVQFGQKVTMSASFADMLAVPGVRAIVVGGAEPYASLPPPESEGGRTLRLRLYSFEPSFWDPIESFADLTELDLSVAALPAVERVAELRSLRRLTMHLEEAENALFAALTRLPDLRELNLTIWRMTRSPTERLSLPRSLERAEFTCGFKAAGDDGVFTALADLPNLRTLTMRRFRPTPIAPWLPGELKSAGISVPDSKPRSRAWVASPERLGKTAGRAIRGLERLETLAIEAGLPVTTCAPEF
ncbi:MAG TPA: hypothetical protein VNC50_07605, partial [Planctomycetia bacterium]|nr:hypothetical protein [Planctomycetia bacterium]